MIEMIEMIDMIVTRSILCYFTQAHLTDTSDRLTLFELN
jgi:hypothetical protein